MTHTREHLTVSELTVISHEVRHSFFLRVRLKRHTLAFTVMSFSRGPKLHTPTKVSYPSSCWWWIGGSSIWCRVAERGGRVCEEFLSSCHGGSSPTTPRGKPHDENVVLPMVGGFVWSVFFIIYEFVAFILAWLTANSTQ